MNVDEHTIRTDVLIIGAGFAGCFAAIRARELGAEVLVVDQGKSGFCGSSSNGTHWNRTVLPEDDHDAAVKSSVLDSDYLVDQEYVEGVIAEAWDRFQQWLDLGSDYERDPNGEIHWFMHNTANTFYKERIAMWKPHGSYQHSLNVKARADSMGAQFIDRIVVTELLTSNGRVVGAVGFNKRQGDFYIFKAKAVVMAAGTSQLIAGFVEAPHATLTGDGSAMALRAGAELRNMEFAKVEPGAQTRDYFDTRVALKYQFDPSFETGTLGTLVNAKGEEILEQYELTYKRLDRHYMAPPWKRHVPIVLKECREGRGPCYMVNRTGDLEFKAEVGIGGHFISQSGGIRINPYGVTSVEGLFAGGITTDMCCAPNYSVPANILGSQITGSRAGESAAEYAKGQSEPAIDEAQAGRFKEEAYAPLGRDKGITEKEVRLKTMETYPYLDCRIETNLARALDGFRNLEQEATDLRANDFHELAKCLKIRNFLQVSQATAMAALERRESRMDHFRHDYPLVDNINWLKWIIVRGTGEGMKVTLEDIPLEKWKYRPEPEMIDRLQPRKEG